MELVKPEASNIEEVLTSVRQYHPAPNLDLIRRAYVLADRAHQGQMRKSGEPYITHPVAVAGLVADLRLDEASICVALLHDTVEDTEVTLAEVQKEFGEEIASLVDGVTKLNQVQFTTKEEQQAENFRKMLIAMSRDIRVILVKLADRVHNMRTLKWQKPEKHQRIAQETLDIYAPLANRLGISWVKMELEDLSFRYLYPQDYKELASRVDEKRSEREDYTLRVVKILEGVMGEAAVRCEVTGRPKHLYSIWKKMKAQGIEYEQVYDAVAFRVFVDEIRQCYEALGVVHTQWSPVPGRFKDYIALPKSNMYRSLHTTVVGPEGRRIEIQIRTWEMHQVAEEGIAAHWKYKEAGSALNLRDEQKFAWLKQLMEWQQELKDPTEFLNTVKVDLFSEEVYVFTPKGDVKVFPKGATPVDFAYAVHSEVGHHCAGARVSGVMVPLDRPLRNGDMVEIITNRLQKPNPDWLEFVMTARARNRIRAFVSKEQRDRAMIIGRELLEKDLRRHGMSLARLRKRKDLPDALRQLGGGVSRLEDVFARIGYNRLSTEQVLDLIIPADKRKADGQSGPAPQVPEPVVSPPRKKKGASAVRVDGVEDMLIMYARCCAPVPGDAIVGFVTRGRGVTVHTRDCPHVLASDPERLIEAEWESNATRAAPISIRVLTLNQPGLLALMTTSITNGGVNIAQAHCVTMPDQRAQNDFELEVDNLAQLQRVMRSLEQIKGVFSVERLRR
jgi:GTP pyrophosphokinase